MAKVLEKKFDKEIAIITEKIVKGYKPETVILFGSAVTGELHESSDIDLFVIKDTKDKFFDRALKVRKIIGDKKLPMDIIVYTPKEVQSSLDKGSFFEEGILKRGRILYDEEI